MNEFCRSESLSEDGLRAIIAANNDIIEINNYKFFHEACGNERVTEGVLRYLLEYFPNAIKYTDELRGQLPIHTVIRLNKNVTLGMVQLLIDAFPDSLRHENGGGWLPLHMLCYNKYLDKEVALEILQLLLERCLESVRHADSFDALPIHIAAAYQSPEFCRLLIEAYPRSERMTDEYGQLPFNWACQCNTVATAKYLYKLYPESINVVDNDGYYPIHYAIIGLKDREIDLDIAVNMIQFLLDCNPNVTLQKRQGKFPLYMLCEEATTFCQYCIQLVEYHKITPKLNVYLKILQILYDAYPDAIKSDAIRINLDGFPEEVRRFINSQLIYARQAMDQLFMTTPDENAQLPLHRALRYNVDLGSIKLLVKGNPSAIRCYDKRGTTPLHVACQHHKSTSVVQHLIGRGEDTLHTMDKEGNTALHYACRGANHAIMALLIDKYGSKSVTKRNAHGQLPIDLLLEREAVSDRESIEYIESIYRLLRANPMNLMHYDFGKAGSRDCVSRTEKKRKIDEGQNDERR